MNLLQLKQKMVELAISERYMAGACGVSEHYLKQIFAMSKPSNKTFEKKVEGVIKTYEIGKAVANRKKKVFDVCQKAKDLKNKKKELGVSYEEIANKTEKHYSAAYIYQLFAGVRPFNKTAEQQIEDALGKLETEMAIESTKTKDGAYWTGVVVAPKEYRVCKKCGKIEDGYGSLIGNDGLCFECRCKYGPELAKTFVVEPPKENEEERVVLKGRYFGLKAARDVVRGQLDEKLPVGEYLKMSSLILTLDDEIDKLVNKLLECL